MKASHLRRLLNLWPPLLFAGIALEHLSEDYSEAVVRLRLSPFNRNIKGTHFGGSLFAMTDPFYMLMLMARLGDQYVVWDKAASIDFVKPGRGVVRARFHLDDDRVAAIRAATDDGSKQLPEFDVEVVDEAGDVVAHVHRVLYVRCKAGVEPKLAESRKSAIRS